MEKQIFYLKKTNVTTELIELKWQIFIAFYVPMSVNVAKLRWNIWK